MGKDALSELDSARWISLEGPESGKISIKFCFTKKQDHTEEGEQEETKEDSKEAADSFVNEVSEAEGRQEPTAEPEKEEKQKETKEEKTADSFVNEVSEAEGRQEPTAEPEKEEDQKETKEEKAKSPIETIGDQRGEQRGKREKRD